MSHDKIETPENIIRFSDSVAVSPYFHEARNAIIRPDQSLPVSRYFLEKWMPRLGPTATCIVLYLRSLGGERRLGELELQIRQREIANAAQCSIRTLQRELTSNAALSKFVRIETRFSRSETGHVRQLENIYFIAMDDPLLPEDEPLVAEIIQQQNASKPSGRVIVKAAQEPVSETSETARQEASDVVRHFVALRSQNDVVRHFVALRENDVVRQNVALRDEIENASHRYDILSPLGFKESNLYINVSESRFRGNSETDSGNIPTGKEVKEKAKRLAQKYGGATAPPQETLKEKNKNENGKQANGTKPANTPAFGGKEESNLGLWRKKSEDLARYSASELGDQPSFGFHIKVWNHARKTDRQKPNAAPMTDALFAILQNLIERRKQTGQPQGKAWTRRALKLFEENSCPMLTKSDEAELQEVRAALKDAPFLQDTSPEN